MSLGPELDEMIPTVLVPTTDPGIPKFVWLKALNSSPLNSTVILSLMRVFFMKAISQFWTPGPIKILRPEVPKRGVPSAKACARTAVVKQLVLNHSEIVFGPVPLQMRSGRGDGEPVLE